MVISTNQFRNLVTTNFADNSTGQIGADDMRTVLNLLADYVDDANFRSMRVFASRAQAVTYLTTNAFLDSNTFIATIESGGVMVRFRNTTSDDPLFTSGDRWGISARLPTVAAVEALIAAVFADVQARRVATATSASFSGTTFPAGTNTVIFRSSTNTSIWAAVTEAVPSPLPSNYQQDQTGQWWQRTWQSSDAAATDALLLSAIRSGAVIPLKEIGGTGDAITAQIAPEFVAAGITSLASDSEVDYIPVATNSAQNPTITIGNATFGIRRSDGSPWMANRFVVGRIYKMRRFGPNLRVTSGEFRGDENDAAIAAATRKLITITSASSGGERNTQNWTQTPGSYVGEGVTALNFAPAGLAAPYTFEVQVEQSASGIWQTWRDVSGRVFNQRRINGVWTGWAEMARQDDVSALSTALQGKAEQSDMAAAGLLLGLLSGDFQTLLQRVYVTVTQLTPDMPVRPNYPRVEWVVYTPPPREIMGDDDRYFLMETPQPPNMPENEIRVLNTRYGNQAVIRVRSVPVLRPPVSGIEYSVDGGGFLPLSGITPGDYFVTIPNGSREVQLRYRNTFNDVSVETLPIPVVISQNSIVPVLTGTGRLHDFDSVNWSYLSVDQNPASRGLILDGTGNVRASHINARLRYGHTGFFVTDQRVRAADVRVHPSAANSFGAIFGVNNNEAGTAAIEVIITATGANIYRRTAATGAGTLLASFTEAWEFPLTSVDVRRAGNDIQLRVGGLLVWTYTLPETHRLLGGTPSIGIMYPNISGADLSLTRFRPDLLGHV